MLYLVPAYGSWNIWHGNPALTGVSEYSLPDTLIPAWMMTIDDDILATPVIQDSLAVFGSLNGILYAVHVSTGQEIWRFDTEYSIEGPALILNDRVFFGTLDGMMRAIDLKSGTLIWTYETEGKITGAANGFRHPQNGNQMIVFGSYDNHLHCLDAETGAVFWLYQTESFINGSPAVTDSGIIFGGCDQKLHLVDFDGNSRNSVNVGSYVAGSAAYFDGLAYLGHYESQVLAVDFVSDSIVWSFGTPEDDRAFYGTPAVTDRFVVIGARDDMVYALNRITGELIWQADTSGPIDSSPVIAGNRVAVCSGGGLLIILDLSSGSLVTSFDAGGPLTASPAVHRDYLIVAAESGQVWAFKMNPANIKN